VARFLADKSNSLGVEPRLLAKGEFDLRDSLVAGDRFGFVLFGCGAVAI
jgi:hypothetical protein